MKEASIIGLDLSKRSFQAHGALADGSVAFRKKLTREKVLGFLAEQPRCTVAMEACGSAHHWGRELCWILGDGVDQAADISWFATSIPSRNFTPRTIFGN